MEWPWVSSTWQQVSSMSGQGLPRGETPPVLKRNSYFLTIKTNLGSKDGKECGMSEDNVKRWQAWLSANETELCAPTHADLQILPPSISHRRSCWDCKHFCPPFLSLIPTYPCLIRFYVFCKKLFIYEPKNPWKGLCPLVTLWSLLGTLWFIDHKMRACGLYVCQKIKKERDVVKHLKY